MKKITLLLSFVACVVFAQAQTNLVVNPGFETWTNGTSPDNWTIPANSTHVGSLTWSKETTIVKSGTSALKLIISTTQNPGIVQVIPAEAGKTYTISFWYFVEAGDDSDVRIWSSWKNGDTYITDKTGMQPTTYAPSNKGNWTKFTMDATAPATTTALALEIRAYKSSTVYFDDIYFGGVTTGTSNPSEDALQAFVSGKNLVIKNAVNGSTVEIFSALGSKVQTSVLEDGRVSLENLSKGLYIVRIGKDTKKFML